MKNILYKAVVISMALMCLCGSVLAANANVDSPNASKVLSYTMLTVSAKSGTISIDALVRGTDTLDRIGFLHFTVEEKIDGEWSHVTTFTRDEDHPEFFAYNESYYGVTTTVDCVANREYRITADAYGKKGSLTDASSISKTVMGR